MAFMFKYSERPRTLAERKYEDDITEEVKGRRLQEIIDVQMQSAAMRTQAFVGKRQHVLIEGVSKRSDEQLFGRNSQNTVVVFPKGNLVPGTYVEVDTHSCTSVTLIGTAVQS